MFIIVQSRPGEHPFHDLQHVNITVCKGVTMPGIAIVLLTAALVVVVALLVAAGAGKLARLDGATYPTALIRAAAAFATVITLAAAVTGALTDVLS
ncbi:hypothetical protein [Streptomyces sp. NPDC059862]|uniref:hypothetical protein n=1 Tax=unclassified Streptomyces TaxID=2593676 RepID=UPI00363142DD